MLGWDGAKILPMPAQRLKVLWTGHRLPVIFVIGILLPGILLAAFAVRTLLQERRLADQEIRQRLELAANGAIRDLNQEFRQWQQAVDALSQAGAQDPSLWPERVRQALERPVSAVVIFRAGQDLRVFPPDQLLYKPAPLLGSSSRQQPDQIYQFGHVKVDFGRCEVSRSDKKVDLTAMEFKFLRACLFHPGQVLTLDQLIEEV